MGKEDHQTTGKMVDAEKVKYICDIYDWDGKGEIDLFFLGDVMYALGMNTTKKVCVGLGQTDEEGKKFAKFDDVVEKVNAAVSTPDSSGGYHDYVEILKEDVQKLLAEIADPEDEDGFFPYMPFVDR